jgi:molybdopterin-dependent oxidoreductase alpha subunit
MRKPNSGGGWQAIWYTLRKGREAGGFWRLWKALRTKNTCKTCALGMGGQSGGMVNEAGHFPEVCKKSLQAMVADMKGAIKSDFFSTYSITQLQQFTPRELEACGRLTQPLLLVAGENYYRPISWDAALEKIAAKLRSIAASETFWYASGRSSNEAGFLLQLFARLYGTNNVNNCSYYCHQASGVGLSSVLGSSAGTVQLEDIEGADLFFLIGGNPASNHPRLMTSLKNLRRRGGQIIVVNPVKETGLVNFRVPSDVRSLLLGSEIASLYVQPHIGGDLSLMTGIAKRIVEIGAHDEQFLNDHCDGWPALKEKLQAVSWEEIEYKSGISRTEIDTVAHRYAAAKNVIFAWTMGITHHAHGVHNVQAIANLALLRGMVGKPFSGLLPIRGHSNVQGMGTVGVTPKLKQAIFDQLQLHYNVKLPTEPGLDTMASMEAAAAGGLKFGLCLGGNLYGANPDAAFAAAALSNLDLLVYLSTTLNTGHAHGLGRETIVLPVLARDEEPQPTTQESMFSYVRLSDGGPARHDGPRSEVQIIADMAQRVLGNSTPIDWRGMEQTSRIREAIGRIVPGLERMVEIDRSGQEFQIAGRTFHQPRFATPSGKAQLFIHDLPELAGNSQHPRPGLLPEGEGEKMLRLMTVRSEGQFNTVVYEDYDLYRGIDRRDVILVHPDDIARFGLQANQPVTVRSETGQMPGIILTPFPDIRPGNALMYYPEANALVPRTVDPQSKTPAFKNVLVTLVPSGTAGQNGPEKLAALPAI